MYVLQTIMLKWLQNYFFLIFANYNLMNDCNMYSKQFTYGCKFIITHPNWTLRQIVYPQPDNSNAARCSHDGNFAEKQDKRSNAVDGNHSENIACQHTKCLSVNNTHCCTGHTNNSLTHITRGLMAITRRTLLVSTPNAYQLTTHTVAQGTLTTLLLISPGV